jgi:hypothetical protein
MIAIQTEIVIEGVEYHSAIGEYQSQPQAVTVLSAYQLFERSLLPPVRMDDAVILKRIVYLTVEIL